MTCFDSVSQESRYTKEKVKKKKKNTVEKFLSNFTGCKKGFQ